MRLLAAIIAESDEEVRDMLLVEEKNLRVLAMWSAALDVTKMQ